VLHDHGYVHGDIAPENFLLGLNNDSPFVFMVDFGRCKKYKDTGMNQHIGYKENVIYSYNSTFASINAHNNVQYSRRDDIESLLYMILYMRLGKLPWAKPNDVQVLAIDRQKGRRGR
jgi:serine/threonine protein kinase